MAAYKAYNPGVRTTALARRVPEAVLVWANQARLCECSAHAGVQVGRATGCSWLNMVEIIFGLITRQAIRRGILN